MIVARNDRQHASRERETPIAAWLALHQDELEVILDDGVRLERLAKEPVRASRPADRVGDLVPDDRCDVVIANAGKCS